LPSGQLGPHCAQFVVFAGDVYTIQGSDVDLADGSRDDVGALALMFGELALFHFRA
jgi:hypothetical protein